MNESSAAEDLATPSSPITLKGTTKGFEILIESSATISTIVTEIEAKLEQAPGFFAGGDVILRFDGTPPRGYLAPIEAVTDRYDLRIVSVQGPEPRPTRSATSPGFADVDAPAEPMLAAGSEPQSALPVLETVEESVPKATPVAEASSDGPLPPKMLVGPIRSGCILEATGHLIILGDVNPGAEVRAAGSIVVLGRLRGIAHAGVEGGSAFILALQLEPQQLRVGSLVARAGDSDQAPTQAEIAYAKDGSIIVESYQGKLPWGIATAKF